MRKLLTTSILLLVLSGSAYAGDIPNDMPTPPTGHADGGVIPNGVAGNMPNGSPQDSQTAADGIVEAALLMLQNVLTIF